MITFRKGRSYAVLLTSSATGGSGYSNKRHSLVTKTWRVMNITAVLLLGICLQVAASGHAQRITYDAKNVSLHEVLTEVKKQTGYDFVIGRSIIAEKIASVKADALQLADFLHNILSPLQLDFSIEYETIFIRSKEKTKNRPALELETPPITVKGKIVNEKGEPVAASVVIKGTNIGATTDSYGSFELQNVPDNATLLISGISIEPQEIKINGKTEINIRSITRIAAEDEVTISTGYISSTKRKSTANISKVTAEQIENQPVTNPLVALQGRVAGLDITPVSGIAGAAPKIRIRGENSLVGFDEGGGIPLYVIDGVPIDSRQLFSNGTLTQASGFDPLATIPVSNIESIEVLKDGAATGIYGSRGANGVILITTKKAKPGETKTKLDLNFYTGAGKVSHFADVLNTRQYLEMRREAKKNDGGVTGSFDFDINGTFDTTRDVNWQKELLGNAAKIHDLQAYVSGGNGRTNFRIGGNLHKETTIYPGDFGFRNIAGFGNINHVTADQKLKLSLTVNYTANQNKLTNSGSFTIVSLFLPPNAPELYTANGELNWQPVTVFGSTFSSWTNPLSYLRMAQEINTDNLMSSFMLEYKIVPELTFKMNAGFNSIASREIATTPISSSRPESARTTTGSSVFTTNNRKIWSIEPQLVYTRKMASHSFTGILGGALQQNDFMAQSISGDGYQSDVLLNSILGAASKQYLRDAQSQYRYVAGFGILRYDYASKYLVDINYRRDGSSRFGPGKQFGNFGGVGIGWLFSNEKALINSSVLSYGKLRGSYAITGNDQIEDYRYYGTYSLTGLNYLGVAAVVPAGLFNSTLGWESTKKAEVALELGFFKSRILIDVAHYRNRSSNQLIDYNLPLTTGFTGVFKNFGATVENKGWEGVITTKNIITRNFQWTSSFNISFPKNNLVAFPGIENSSYATRYQVGRPLSVLSQYHYTGVDPTGKYTFLDVDSNGVMDSGDKMFTYSTDKSVYGGLMNTFVYKSFELSFLFQFSRQMRFKLLSGNLPGYIGNQPLYVLNRWQKPGDITDVQRYNANFSLAAAYNNIQLSDYIREDASFIRMKTLYFSWRLPAQWINKLGLSQSKLFVQGQNLFTLTDYSGLDPETGAMTLPPLRMVTAGIQLNF